MTQSSKTKSTPAKKGPQRASNKEPVKSSTKGRNAQKPANKAGGAKDSATVPAMSLLDAAAKLLKEKGEAMRTGDMVEVILERGWWETKGKTPAATLNSAIMREIKTKGSQSRFKKSGRGLYVCSDTQTQ